TGESKEIASSSENEPNDSEKRTFVVNKNSKKFHEEDCANANKYLITERWYSIRGIIFFVI
ncbi:hypothetical protein LV813_23700, partial [[Clostridium] innocuum]|nr:hypothetical protein [[Clostridium] innocuum]